MSEWSHHPSAGMDPEEPLVPGWGVDMPGGRGPETVRRFDDHHITAAYPRAPHGMVRTLDGWEPISRKSPPFAAVAATGDEAEAPASCQEAEAASASGVVDSDPPRSGIFLLPPFWRKAATILLVPATIVALLFASLLTLLIAVCDGVVAGWREFCDSVMERFEWRDIRRAAVLAYRALLLAWRGR